MPVVYHTEVKGYGSTTQFNSNERKQNARHHDRSAGKVLGEVSFRLQNQPCGRRRRGLTISEKMRKQIRGLDRASTNAQDGVSAVQTAEGALTEVHSMLQRMNELAVQASNGTNSVGDRQALQNEIAQLTTEIDRVAETTKFNETYLLKGDGTTIKEYMKAHDAGLKGTMTETLDRATFTIDELKDRTECYNWWKRVYCWFY